MDYQDILVSCKNCEIKIPMSKTRFDKTGHVLICLKCYKDIYGVNGEKILQTADPNRTSYSCSYCNYKFSRSKEIDVLVCPYCSKSGLNQDSLAITKVPDKRLSDY